jgi:MFS family permease
MLRLIPVFVISVFLSLNFGALLYLNSTFLGEFFGTTGVSLIFILAAVANIYLFFLAPRLLKAFGKGKLLFRFLFITLLATLGLAFSKSGWPAALSLIIYESFIFMAYYCLDIFLEEHSQDNRTGEIRGLYFTFLNAGIACGPLLLSLLGGAGLRPIYLVSTVLLIIPIILALMLSVGDKPSPAYRHEPINLPFKTWWHKRDIRAVSLTKLVLETFYGFMIIFTPIYLHKVLGFGWTELGIIFTVALLPFVLLEWPAGELADRFWGEKEMMSAGFFLMGSALLVMPFLNKSFTYWMLILLLSRVGASMVEITTESYFFKKIDASQTGLLSIFRLLRPAGLIFGALLGGAIIALFSFHLIFFVVAGIILIGLYESLYLRDTL